MTATPIGTTGVVHALRIATIAGVVHASGIVMIVGATRASAMTATTGRLTVIVTTGAVVAKARLVGLTSIATINANPVSAMLT